MTRQSTDADLIEWALDQTGCDPTCVTRDDERVTMARVIAVVRSHDWRANITANGSVSLAERHIRK